MDYTVFKPVVKELIQSYYRLPENAAGGCLHIFLDDGNIDIHSLRACQAVCEEQGDTFGFFLCDVLAEFDMDDLEAMFELDWWGMRSAKVLS